MARTVRAISGSGVLLIQMALRVGTPLIVSPLLVRYNGSDALGAYSMILEIIGYLLLLDLGVSQAMTREIAQLQPNQDFTTSLSRIATTSLRLLAVLGILVAALVLVLAHTVPFWLKADPATIDGGRTAIFVLAIWMPLRFPMSFFQSLLYGRQKIAHYAASDVVGELARAALSVAAVAAGWGLVGLALVTVVTQFITFALCIAWTREEIRLITWTTRVSAQVQTGLLRVSYPLALMSLGDRLSFLSQNAIVGVLFDARTAGRFYATRAPAFFGAAVLWRMSDSIFPGLNELFASNQREALCSVYQRILGYILGAALWLTAGAIAFNEFIVRVWLGPSLFLGRTVTIAVALMVLLMCWKNVATKFIVLEGKLQSYKWLVLGEGLVALLLAVVFVKYWGAAGVVWASLIANSITFPYLLLRPPRILGLSVVEVYGPAMTRAVRCSAAGVAMSILVFVLSGYLSTTVDWVLALIMALVVGGVGFLLFGLTHADRASLLSVARIGARRG